MDELTNGATMSGATARTVSANQGINWWSAAWALFTKNAGMWIVFALILLGIFIVLAFIPLLGTLAASLLLPVFIGSWMLAARKLESGGALEVGDLFSAFKDKLTPLLVVGGLLLVASLVIGLVAGMLGFGAVMGMAAGGASHSAGGALAAAGAGMLAMLVALLLGVIVGMAVWFAPALVVFRGVAPVEALKASFSACLKNVVPFVLYGVIYLVAAILASIVFGLGWIVLLPVVLLTQYVSYQDIFE